MRSVKELWSKSFGVFVFFLTRIKQAKAAAAWWWWPPKKTLLLGVMQIRPETSKFLCLCCMIPFFCSALAKRSKAHARKLLIYFFSFPLPFFLFLSTPNIWRYIFHSKRNQSIYILLTYIHILTLELSYLSEQEGYSKQATQRRLDIVKVVVFRKAHYFA